MAVHGGAWNIPDELWPAHQEGCKAAYQAGYSILEKGGSAVDAIVAAMCVLEDDPVFDAGYGSFLNEAGQVELDAGLMEGKDLRSGAVLGVSKIKNPIRLARLVMDQTDHCIFTHDGAHSLANRHGMEMVDPAIHIHERERDILERIKSGDSSILETAWASSHDTVGAIAMDSEGNLAAGNSTGGVLNKMVGRIGDAPLIGQGFYADNERGAFVCTGWGEALMRSATGMYALDALSRNSPGDAARAAIDHLARRVNGYGGVLLMTPRGDCAVAHNTQRMAWYTGSEI